MPGLEVRVTTRCVRCVTVTESPNQIIIIIYYYIYIQDFNTRDVDWTQGVSSNLDSSPLQVGYLGSTLSCIQHDNMPINDMAKQITSGAFPDLVRGCSSKLGGVYSYIGILGEQGPKLDQWFAGMGQVPHLRNFMIKKGVQMRIRRCGSYD